MRNVQSKSSECQNVEHHHCGNCEKNSRNSGKRAIESEVKKVVRNFLSHDGMAENDEIDHVSGAISSVDELQSIDRRRIIRWCCNHK